MRGRAPAQGLAHSKRPVTVPECLVCSSPPPSPRRPEPPGQRATCLALASSATYWPQSRMPHTAGPQRRVPEPGAQAPEARAPRASQTGPDPLWASTSSSVKWGW